ncbi:MAG: ribulose-phosphate 3-epimerase, partial [Desulfovibrio sp.]|nr:ribulose-phosphate 3-epimerase [Desulfovibrio sp.]
MILSPSLLSSDFGRLAEELAALEAADLKWVHWDVMDGLFVPNITIGPLVIKALRKRSKLFFDVHLMIERPERYLTEFVDAGADLVCVHAEATMHLERAVAEIARLG